MPRIYYYLLLSIGIAGLGTKALEFLLDHGADPHARTSFGDTPAHYAALGGSLRILKFLVEEKGVSMSKACADDDKGCVEAYHAEADRLCDNYNLSDETRKEMKMTFLQKVAQSCCIEKSNWVIDGMMNTRMLLASNQSIGVNENDSWIVIYQELSERQREFKWMADELVMDIRSPDSALKIFLRRAPDCVEHLLNRCVVTFCKDQIQGNIFFDFFLLFPPPPPKGASADLTHQEVGELTLLETLIQARKERFLTHPVFETFLKLKWYRTWRLYLVILLMSATFTVSLLGYVLTRFGNVLDSPVDPYTTDSWWYFLAVTTTYTALIDVCKIWYVCSHCLSCPKDQANRILKDPSLALHMAMSKAKDTAIPILSLILLNVGIDAEVRRYVAAVSAVLSCFNFMLALSRLPKVGIYIFMLNKVFGTIISFFVSYFWHFLGYAVAFHILMPGKDGAFSSLGNSVIKVRNIPTTNLFLYCRFFFFCCFCFRCGSYCWSWLW